MADEIIDGYRLANVLANFHSSQIWEVSELGTGRHYCMKLLLPEKVGDAEQRRLLIHEGTIGKEFAHPNLLKIIKVNKDPKNPYFLTEFFPVLSIKQRILRKQYDFIKQHAQNTFIQIAKALGYVNARGWVHRDVKPDNIVVNGAGEVRLIDFTLVQKMQKPSFFAKLFKRKSTTQGTRSYMSPEQIRGEELDGRADIYSFGATMYEIVTYRPPFRAASNQELLNKHIAEKPVAPQAYNADLTNEFSSLVLQMLAKKRDERPRDFQQVVAQLQKIRVYKTEAAAPADK